MDTIFGMLLGRLELFAVLVLFFLHFGEIKLWKFIKKQTFSETFKVYFDQRMIKILLRSNQWIPLGNNWK